MPKKRAPPVRKETGEARKGDAMMQLALYKWKGWSYS